MAWPLLCIFRNEPEAKMATRQEHLCTGAVATREGAIASDWHITEITKRMRQGAGLLLLKVWGPERKECKLDLSSGLRPGI